MSVKHLPAWRELPAIELYLDQVLIYVNEFIPPLLKDEGKGLTASMINNYVKLGYIEKPKKKKYDRAHLAALIMISFLKNVFSIQEICKICALLKKNGREETIYDAFILAMSSETSGEQNPESAEIPELMSAACQVFLQYQRAKNTLHEMEAAYGSML